MPMLPLASPFIRFSRMGGMLVRGLKTFPVSCAWCLLVTLSLLGMVNVAGYTNILSAILSGSCLGIVLSLALSVYTSQLSTRIEAWKSIILWAFATLIPLWKGYLTYAGLSDGMQSSRTDLFQSIAIYVAAILCVMLASLRKRDFMEYLDLLLESLSASLLMAGILGAGISATLASIDALFDVEIAFEVYLNVCIVGVFALGWLNFLGALSYNLESQVEPSFYPAFSYKLVTWILRPLALLYLGVIVAYAIKILYMWELPRGIVSYMVWGYGLLLLAQFWMSDKQQESSTCIFWNRLLSWTFIVPATLLAIGIGRRLYDYGLTEQRMLLLFGSFLLFSCIVLHGSLGRRVWPLSFIAILIFSLGFSAGPYGLGALCRISQQNRLQLLLIKNGMWENGSLLHPKFATSTEEKFAITQQVSYLYDTHGSRGLSRWIAPSADTRGAFFGLLGFSPVSKWEMEERTHAYVYRSDPATPLMVTHKAQCMQLKAFDNQDANIEDSDPIVPAIENNALHFRQAPWKGLVVPLHSFAASLMASKDKTDQPENKTLSSPKDASRYWVFHVAEAYYFIENGQLRIRSIEGLFCAE